MKKEALGAAAVGSFVVVVSPLLGHIDAPAVSAYPACPVGPNSYSMQYATKGYKGQYGWLHTYTPAVPNYEDAFSLSHLYSFTQRSGPGAPVFERADWFVEVGWYKGEGAPDEDGITAHPFPRYYTAKGDSMMPYKEYNYEEASRDVNIQYEIQYVGLHDASDRYMWSVYTDDFSSPRHTWFHKDMAVDVPTVGGEVDSEAAQGTQMLVHADPRQQLKEVDDSWHNWTPSYMNSKNDTTSACDDLGFTFRWNQLYEDFDVNGER